jgi:hypothetical protein
LLAAKVAADQELLLAGAVDAPARAFCMRVVASCPAAKLTKKEGEVMTTQKPDADKSAPAKVDEQPEALATFAAAARRDGRKPDDVGLTATAETAPIPTDDNQKAEAATKVLRREAFGGDQGAEKAVDALPDRTQKK